LTSGKFLAKEIENPTFSTPEVSATNGDAKKWPIYTRSGLGGFGGGVKRIYRAFQFNVNAYYIKGTDFVKDFF
jgi:hypothetical protein